MNLRDHHPVFRAARRAFSLLELLVAIGLLTVVILTLYAMFDQTQKALHANIAQTDVMESGRSVMELIVRDIERAQSPNLAGAINLAIQKADFVKSASAPDPFVPPGTTDAKHRDYPLNDLFFLGQTQSNLWTAFGFYVGHSTNASKPPDETLGTLYRFQDPYPQSARGLAAADRFLAFYTLPKATSYSLNRPDPKNENFLNRVHRATNSTRLLDNVLFFRVLPFGREGLPVDQNTLRTYLAATNPLAKGITVTNQTVYPYYGTGFTGTALPSAVEIELGMLSPRLWSQYTNQVSFDLKTNFLAKHTADILVFRQRIPLRTALQ
jgi:type II secretory pathway pseudopilin PulG